LKTIALVAAVAAVVLSACSANENEENLKIESVNALYLRGEMNDYAVSETYRLRESADGLCTQATLRSDWSPYKFKFADASWSQGQNFGYLNPPGALRLHAAPQKLNPNSHFEDLRFYPEKDGVYRFCLLKKSDGFYATVTLEKQSAIKPLLSEITASLSK
jgi:hypothetical protein